MPVDKWAQRAFALILIFCCLTNVIGGTFAGPSGRQTLSDRRTAVQSGIDLERSRKWLEAMEHYEQAVKVWPENNDLKYGLRRSKIHFGIDRRYSDASFQTKLSRKSRRESLILFDEVFSKVRSHFVDPLSATSFVAHGTESLYLALANDKFLNRHLSDISKERIRRMRRTLREEYWNKPIAYPGGARQTVDEVCDIAHTVLGLPSGAVVMEYIFGGCNALDDYSNFLTPERLEDLYDNIDGEFVGLGIEMKAESGRGLLLINVLPDSPASDGGVQAGEHIISIDGTDCRDLSTDEAAGMLRGPVGSRVRLEVTSKTDAQRSTTLTRRPVQVKSIPAARIIDRQAGIGYLKMSGFQKTSAAELDAALTKLRAQGMQSLIWDLRGNPGGLLTAAVEVLDRFLENGVLVSTKGRTSDQNWTYSAHRPGTSNIHLVLLIDGESASASEIVAGAIRDHRRGTIVGRRSYGKWSVQSIFPIPSATGLRLTTAKFYSPNGHTLGKIGVVPDVGVDLPAEHPAYYNGSSSDYSDDRDMETAVQIVRRRLSRR